MGDLIRTKRASRFQPLSPSSLPTSLGSLVLIDDILPLILDHLSTPDLLSCLYASRLFFNSVTRILYSTVVYGREWEKIQNGRFGKPISIPRNVFQGVEKPPLPKPVPSRSFIRRILHFSPNRILQESMGGPRRLVLSSMKIQALSHIRDLTYYGHPSTPSDFIPLSNLLPSLDTLTIISHRLPSRRPHYQEVKWGLTDPDPEPYPIDWKSPLLRSLRPKHLRLIHLPAVQMPEWTQWTHYPLKETFGSSVERLTIHFMTCVTDRYGRPLCHRGHPVTFTWPIPPPIDAEGGASMAGLKRLDLVFMLEDEPGLTDLGASRPVFYSNTPPSLRQEHIAETTAALAEILASAVGKGDRALSIRLVGLGTEFIGWKSPDMFIRSKPNRYDLQKMFETQFRADYIDGLRRTGMAKMEAAKWAGELEYVLLRQYDAEEDCLPF